VNSLIILVQDSGKSALSTILKHLYLIGEPFSFERMANDKAIVQSYFEQLEHRRLEVRCPSPDESAKGALGFEKEGALGRKKVKLEASESSSESFVLTPSLCGEVKELRLVLLQARFVLISGRPHSGKASLLSFVCSREKQIAIYVDSTTDIKSLIGSYICGASIG